jgi:hypothetical protein
VDLRHEEYVSFCFLHWLGTSTIRTITSIGNRLKTPELRREYAEVEVHAIQQRTRME